MAYYDSSDHVLVGFRQRDAMNPMSSPTASPAPETAKSLAERWDVCRAKLANMRYRHCDICIIVTYWGSHSPPSEMHNTWLNDKSASCFLCEERLDRWRLYTQQTQILMEPRPPTQQQSPPTVIATKHTHSVRFSSVQYLDTRYPPGISIQIKEYARDDQVYDRTKYAIMRVDVDHTMAAFHFLWKQLKAMPEKEYHMGVCLQLQWFAQRHACWGPCLCCLPLCIGSCMSALVQMITCKRCPCKRQTREQRIKELMSKPTWVCSELVAAALQVGGLAPSEAPITADPTTLAWLLSRRNEEERGGGGGSTTHTTPIMLPRSASSSASSSSSSLSRAVPLQHMVNIVTDDEATADRALLISRSRPTAAPVPLQQPFMQQQQQQQQPHHHPHHHHQELITLQQQRRHSREHRPKTLMIESSQSMPGGGYISPQSAISAAAASVQQQQQQQQTIVAPPLSARSHFDTGATGPTHSISVDNLKLSAFTLSKV